MSKKPELRIESGIPIPPVGNTRVGSNARLLQSMKPGDSVFFDAPIAAKAPRFYRVAKRLGVEIVIRKEAGGSRLWLAASQPAPKAAPRPPAGPHGRQAGKQAKGGDARASGRSAPAASKPQGRTARARGMRT